uniref:Ependymin-like 1 n=1 Tax=Mola mola TaxID=94237 RepID=A0A3Q3WFU0_MOLML
MMFLVLFTCMLAGCLAQQPHPCGEYSSSDGSFDCSTQSEKLLAFAMYTYDALGKRIRVRESGFYSNKTFNLDALLLYRERVMYSIDYKTRTCLKKPLDTDFQPMEIPQNATLLSQAVLGSSSGPGQGLLVNTWVGEMQQKERTAQYLNTVTEFGCVPVTSLFRSGDSGWVVTSFFNNIIGVLDPEQLLPPSFCKDAQLDEREEPVNFFSLF